MSRLLLPTDIPNPLLFWGDVQTSANVTKSGTNVSALATRGGLIPSVAAAGTAYPVLSSAGLNGFDAINTSSGALNAAISTAVAANTPVNIFFVGNLPTGAGGYLRSGVLVPSAGGTNDAYGGISFISSGAGGAGQLRAYNIFNGTLTSTTLATTHVYAAYTLDGTSSNISVDANGIVNSTTQAPYFNAALDGFGLGGVSGGGLWTGLIGEYIVFTGAMTQDSVDKMIGYLANRWANTAPLPSGFAYKTAAPMVADSGTTGTLTAIQAAQTLTAAGTLGTAPLTGSLTATQASQTLTASGSVTSPAITGTLSATQAPQTLSATGTIVQPAISGAMTATQAPQMLSATGGLGSYGTLSATQAPQTLTASGTVQQPITSSLSATQRAQTVTASGSVSFVPIGGTLTATQAAQALTASGTLAAVLTGSLTASQARQTLTASGTVSFIPISGALSATQARQALSSAGTIAQPPITGALSSTQLRQALNSNAGIVQPSVTALLVATQLPQTSIALGTLGLFSSYTIPLNFLGTILEAPKGYQPIPPITIQASVPQILVGSRYALQPRASGGTGIQSTWSFVGTLPNGTTFDKNTGSVAGIIAPTGYFEFLLLYQDNNGTGSFGPVSGVA